MFGVPPSGGKTSLRNIGKPAPKQEDLIAAALLAWFSAHARPLPWRRTNDPYAIWISEIMLQQTQVKTVIPYWERWMQELPEISALSAAPIEKVLKLWEGLGYYTRARNLQQAARTVMEKHGGKFPRDFEAILALPGIGRYTAGAIASIAFNQPAPVLDGNVTRVLTRLYGIHGNAREKEINRRLWGLAERLVEAADRAQNRRKYPGRTCSFLNQSLMELGATICTPRQAQCAICPLKQRCVALTKGEVANLPNLGTKAAATARRFIALVMEKDGEFFVRQRAANEVNGLLWEFPNFEQAFGVAATPTIVEKELGIRVGPLQKFVTLKHTITRYRITLEAYRTRMLAGRLAGRWAAKEHLGELTFSSAHRKLVMRLGVGVSE